MDTLKVNSKLSTHDDSNYKNHHRQSTFRPGNCSPGFFLLWSSQKKPVSPYGKFHTLASSLLSQIFFSLDYIVTYLNYNIPQTALSLNLERGKSNFKCREH